MLDDPTSIGRNIKELEKKEIRSKTCFVYILEVVLPNLGKILREITIFLYGSFYWIH